MHHRVRGVLLVALVVVALAPGAATALDLTGKWRFQPTDGFVFGSPQIVQVTQSGSALTFNFSIFLYAGTVTAGVPFSTYTVKATGACLSQIDGRIMPSENLLDGRVLTLDPPFPVLIGGVVATRCTCDDGNTVNGDGCDDHCQVEPCWTCSGDPSACSPVSDGGACEDGSPCTTGQTCSGGVCGGGTPVSPCTDMTGVWRRHREVPGLGQTSDTVTAFSQRGTDLIADSYVGTIDPATGAFDLRRFNPYLFCFIGFDPLIGTVAADGMTYTATGSVDIPNEITPDVCDSFALTETGTRCGTGIVDPSEVCDDGNAIDGDGCSAGCTVEPCWQCTGQPSVCLPTPRTPCKDSLAPNQSLLSIKNRPDDATDKITWLWKTGAATALAELGNPVGGDDYVLCVYDESTTPPGLLFRALLPGGGSCGAGPCWKAKGAKGFSYKNLGATPEGITLTKLNSGEAGAAKAVLKGKGVHLSDRPLPLPAPMLPTPLRVQLHGAGGLCLETTHSAAGVVKNDPASGVFKAHGTP